MQNTFETLDSQSQQQYDFELRRAEKIYAPIGTLLPVILALGAGHFAAFAEIQIWTEHSPLAYIICFIALVDFFLLLATSWYVYISIKPRDYKFLADSNEWTEALGLFILSDVSQKEARQLECMQQIRSTRIACYKINKGINDKRYRDLSTSITLSLVSALVLSLGAILVAFSSS